MMKPIDFTLNGTVFQDRRPSPNVWKGIPFNELLMGHLNGLAFHDDFCRFGLPGTQTTEINHISGYKLYATTAGVWRVDTMPHATTGLQTGGIISGLADSDGDQVVIGTQACPFSFDTTLSGVQVFEARIAQTSIATAMGQLFLGLSENSTVTFGAAIPLADADATSSTNAMIGFNRLEDGLGVLNTSYADHAATWTNIQASANTTLAANTWIKLGIRFEPKGDPLRAVRFFVDGVECTTAMTRAALLATTFLDAVGLGPCLAFFADTGGTANYTYLDWWRWAILLD